jgi:hypothetical protein
VTASLTGNEIKTKKLPRRNLRIISPAFLFSSFCKDVIDDETGRSEVRREWEREDPNPNGSHSKSPLRFVIFE